jgi:dihydroneopterin aldolase
MQADSNVHDRKLVLDTKSNRIHVRLKLNTILGVNPHERFTLQPIEVELEIFTNQKPDDQNTFIKNIKKIIRRSFLNEKPFLLERMAYILIRNVCETHKIISLIQITLKKPMALPHARYAIVRMQLRC